MNNPTPKTTPKTVNEKEQETLAFWQAQQIFEKSVKTPAGESPKGDFSFYDGPPFATGLPHYGHILAGTIKDAIPRYQTMQGKSVRRKWGWDCHGLPIENLIEKKLGLKSKKEIEDYGIGKFNRDAFDSVMQYDEEWKKVIPRLGRWVDMEHPYKTMDATYTESIWWAWKELSKKGLAYEGFKMMHICPRCETTLAQSEVGMNYEDITDLSVTAKFELQDEPNTFILAWTTTPWTLPGNTALALKKDAEYVKISIEGMEGYYVLAKERLSEVLKEIKYEVLETFLGESLVGKTYKPVFPYFQEAEIENKENIYKIWHADFITLDTGTGIAHEAPAFGAEDMELAKAQNIPILKHIKMDGTFIPAVTDFAGMKVKVAGDTQSADIEIIKYLAHAGFLFEKHKIIHSYPLCWRCKTPLLNYATSSWFVDVPQIKNKLISENQKIGWIPEHTKDGRFGKWLEGAREWAVSRTRYWGAPLPVWRCKDCEEIKVIGSFAELAEDRKSKNEYYVMRHGESISNVEGFIDVKGNKENKLTEKGIKGVEESIAKAKEIGFDLVVSSPLLRAKESASIIASSLGIEIKTDARLAEIGIDFWDGKAVSEFHENETLIFQDIDAKSRDGESHRDVLNRTMACLYDFEKEYVGKKILLVTHSAPILMMQAGSNLSTDSDILDTLSGNIKIKLPVNGEIVSLVLKVVPRDETGKINVHRPYVDEFTFDCKCGGQMKRIPDVFDCWFESGSMPFASVHYPFENKTIFEKNYPADFIAEGMDQTRGWFYSLINLGVGLFDKAPYKHVIVNGMVLAESGLKMSKSENNYTDPMLLVEKYGADAMRYALLSSPVVKGENLQFNDENVSDIYKKLISRLENVVSLYEMNKPEGLVAKDTSSQVLDRWMISRINELVRDSTQGYDNYLLDEATRGVADVIDDISVWYTRRSRERLKGDNGKEDQLLAYQTLTHTLVTLAKVVAPVMPFIAERVYKQVGGEKESVHLESWPKAGEIEETLLKDMKDVREIVSLGLMKRTESKINVKQPLLAVTLKKNLAPVYFELIQDEINVKKVIIDESQEEAVTLDVTVTPELLQEGDVRKLIRAVQDMRKEKGLSPQDSISLAISSLADLGDISLLKNNCKITDLKEDINIAGQSVELSSGIVVVSIV